MAHYDNCRDEIKPKQPKFRETKCYKVLLPITYFSEPALVTTGNDAILNSMSGDLYVLSDNPEEVGRLFPAAKSIVNVGIGYTVEETS